MTVPDPTNTTLVGQMWVEVQRLKAENERLRKRIDKVRQKALDCVETGDPDFFPEDVLDIIGDDLDAFAEERGIDLAKPIEPTP